MKHGHPILRSNQTHFENSHFLKRKKKSDYIYNTHIIYMQCQNLQEQNELSLHKPSLIPALYVRLNHPPFSG